MPVLGLGLSLRKYRNATVGLQAPPTGLIVTPTFADPTWTLQVDWTAPDHAPVDYTVQLQDIAEGTWGNDQEITHPTVTYTYPSLDDGRYRVRVRANYPEGSSFWVTSGTINAFITERYVFNEELHSVRI